MFRFGLQALKHLLLAALLFWILAAPLIWILRDGLGPDAVDSVGLKAVLKFLVGWGPPALVLALPLIGLWYLERRRPAT